MKDEEEFSYSREKFERNQIDEWKENYFDYDAYFKPPMSPLNLMNPTNNMSPMNNINKIPKLISNFENKLNINAPQFQPSKKEVKSPQLEIMKKEMQNHPLLKNMITVQFQLIKVQKIV